MVSSASVRVYIKANVCPMKANGTSIILQNVKNEVRSSPMGKYIK